MSSLGTALLAKIHPSYEELTGIGTRLGKLQTSSGLPLDVSLNKLDYPKDEKVVVLDGACKWFIEHKRISGAGEKSINRQRKLNLRMLEDFMDKGKLNVY